MRYDSSHSKGKAPMRALDAGSSSSHETAFLADETPVDKRRSGATELSSVSQDSHDLHFSNVTRDSVVDNMLMSLDALSNSGALLPSHLLDDARDREPFPPSDMHFSPLHISRTRPTLDDPDAASARVHSRGRRSNSTNEFYPTAQRTEGMASKSYGSARVSSDTSRKPPLYGDGGSAHLPPSSRRSNRSASLDDDGMSSVLERGWSAALDNPTLDVAPTSAAVYLPAVPPPCTRQSSAIRSPSSKGSWSGKARGPDASIRAQATEFVNAINAVNSPEAQMVIPVFADSAPLNSNNNNSRPSTHHSRGLPKERRGFFSRVFGSGRSQPPQEPLRPTLHQSHLDHPSSEPASHPSTVTTTTTSTAQHDPAQVMAKPATPRSGSMASVQRPPSEPQQLKTLAKKNSSFFRRRKKSAAEDPFPPPMPVWTPRVTDPGTAVLPSPPISSSSRNAPTDEQQPAPPRNLHHHTRNDQSFIVDDSGHPGGFSPDYTPHKDATIRAVKPDSHPPLPAHAFPLDIAQGPHDRYKLKVKRGGQGLRDITNDDTPLVGVSSEQQARSATLPLLPKSEPMHVSDLFRRPASSPASPPDALQHVQSGKENARLQQKANVGEKRAESQPSSWLPQKSAAAGRQADDDGYFVTTCSRRNTIENDRDKNGRVWLEPDSSDEQLDGEHPTMRLPPNDRFPVHRASIPVVKIEGGHVGRASAEEAQRTTHLPTAGPPPTEADRETAQRIYDGDETFVSKSKAAAWLGEKTEVSARCRLAYMEIFEWTGFSILLAMRDLCNKLVLKGETQEVDRVLDAFAIRWCECNPNHGFKSPGAVHTICYSILLLNTDLHMADIESRMTRTQFVKNTLPTIRGVVDDEIADAIGRVRDQQRPDHEHHDDRSSVDMAAKKSRNRLSIRPPIGPWADSDSYTTNPDSGSGDACTILVKAPLDGTMAAWEFQIMNVLKEFYNSIKSSRLPLHGVEALPVRSSSNNLLVAGVLRRSPSVLSKTPSDTTSHRGRHGDFRSATARWSSKSRTRPKLYPNSTIGSSRTSLDDQSVFSPTGSSKWSTYSMGKTGTSMSVDSLGTHFAAPDYHQSIGFANALSQAIIREGNEENHTLASHEEYARVAPLLDDESLELHGPPFAKEGILKHKRHLEATDKAKDRNRNWNEVFAVIEKGYIKTFTFNMTAKSVRSRAKRRPSAGGVVGGGNWTDNATQLDSFLLRQTMASSLPPPGYSESRPHVFALSLPNGAVHLFSAGTADLVKEYVQTANYWSARLSKEPLVGSVSNIEYGWGDNVINTALIPGRCDSSSTTAPVSIRPSIQGSIRSSIDHGATKPRMAGDRVVLSDWTPPAPSMMASNLLEVDQYKALDAYVKNVEEEMHRHQQLRAPLMIAYSPRHPNAAKAMTNFDKKSAYLLHEIVKFKTYVDALNHANGVRDKIYKERDERIKAEEEASAAAAAAAKQDNAGRDGNQVGSDEDDMSDPTLSPSHAQHPVTSVDALTC